MVNSIPIDIETLDSKELEITAVGGYNRPNGYGLFKADFYALWYDSECEERPAGILTFDDPMKQETYTYSGPLSEYEVFQVADFISTYDFNDDWID